MIKLNLYAVVQEDAVVFFAFYCFYSIAFIDYLYRFSKRNHYQWQ